MLNPKLYKLTYDDFKSLSVGDVLYYKYRMFLFECEVISRTRKRVIVLCNDHIFGYKYKRYILVRNFHCYYKE